MAEAIGLAASVVAVLQLTYSVISICYEYRSIVRNAPRDLEAISDQLIGLRTVLEQLDKLQTRQIHGGSHLATLRHFDELVGPLIKCKDELELLMKKLASAKGWKKRGQALIWPLGERDVKKTLEHLERCKTLLTLALTANQTSLTLAVEEGVAATRHNINSLKESSDRVNKDTLRKDIYKWLSAVDPSSNHNNARRKHQPVTGAWLTKGDRFTNWKEEAGSSLWLFGKPGCGKTILCSTVIQELLEESQSTPEVAVAYYYFDFSDTRKQTFDGLLKSLITQIASYRTNIPIALQSLYHNNRDGRSQPSTLDLIGVLHEIVSNIPHVFLICDALDECKEREPLLEWIRNLLLAKLGNLHLLVTSRRERDIELNLQPYISGEIGLHGASVDNDIRVHVNDRLQNDERLRRWTPEVQAEIRDKLTIEADAMFRWVTCQLDDLRKCIRVGQLRNKLDTLPRSLDETYDRILLGIDEEHRKDAFKVLQWLAFSECPMTLAEVAETLAIDEQHFRPDQRLPDPRDVLMICSSLVTISDSLSNPQDYPAYDSRDPLTRHTQYRPELNRELRLAHFSVKEYLTSERIRLGNTSEFSLSRKQVDNFLSESCLAYLLQFNDSEELDYSTILKFPLARYAAEHWVFHANSMDNCIDDRLQHLINALLQPESTHFINWFRLCDPELAYKYVNLDRTSTYRVPPLYYASLYGLEDASKHLLSSCDVDVNAIWGRFGNALQAASYGGHKTLVQLLLQRGANVNANGGEYGNALRAACDRGHHAVVEVLLNSGADVNSNGGWDGTALQAASLLGHQGLVRLLLNSGAEVNSNGGKYGNALQASSFGGHDEIVRLLIDSGADVNANGGPYGKALQTAAIWSHKGVVQMLLAGGAEVNANGGRYGNALQAASLVGERELVQLLLDSGADVNARGGEFGNALQAASYRGHKAVVESLLRSGADVNAIGGPYGNALRTASIWGHQEVVQMLLDGGADPNLIAGQTWNALQAASIEGHQLIAQLLLDGGADPKATGRNGNDALQMASLQGRREIVRLLLDRGADVNAKGGRYGNALQAASAQGYEAVVRLLIESGADVKAYTGGFRNSRRDWFSGALEAASYGGYHLVVQQLLESGADVNAKGYRYGNPLQAASYGGHQAVVQLLLDSGADVKANEGRFGNALEAACYGGYQVVVRQLLENGADVNVHGGEYGNALQAASYEGREAVVQLLLDYGADVNANGGRFGSALQAASLVGYNKVVKLLLHSGADITAQGGEYGSALQAASYGGHRLMVKLLLEGGADSNTGGGCYGNALQAASHRGHLSVVQLLLDGGANVNTYGGEFGNALHAAQCGGHEEVAQLLLDSGADGNARGATV